MRWYDQTEERFRPGVVYTHKDLIEMLKADYPYVSPNSYQWAINSMIKDGKIAKTGYNQYTVITDSLKPVFKPSYSELAAELIQKIDTCYPESTFVLLESAFMNLFRSQPVRQNTVFIQGDKEKSRSIFRSLQEWKYPNLLYKPSVKEFDLYRTEDSIVILDLTSEAPLLSDRPHEICIEKLLVDVFCDKYLRKDYDPAEYPLIVEQAMSAYAVDKVRLLRYARRRGKEEEIQMAAPVLLPEGESESEKKKYAILEAAAEIVSSLPKSQREFFDDISGGKVSQAQFARYYGVTPQAITNRINRLFKTILRRLEAEHGYSEDEVMKLTRSKNPVSFIRKIWL